jgi:hypothetical protein
MKLNCNLYNYYLLIVLQWILIMCAVRKLEKENDLKIVTWVKLSD